MSLLTSIFGGTGQERQQRAGSSSTVEDDGGAHDLFGPKVVDADDAAMAVPPVVRKSRSKSAAGKGAVIEATTTSGEGANDVERTDAEDVGRIATSGGGDTNVGGEGVANSSRIPEEGEGEEAEKTTIDEKTTKVAAVARNKSREEDEDEKSRTIFVGNLPPDISRRALANMFKTCGIVSSSRLRSLAVTGVKLPPEQAGNQNMMRKVCANTGKVSIDNTTKKSSQGYVVFENVESVDRALFMNNTPYLNHTIRVDRANPTVEPSRSVFVGNLPYGADEESLRDHFASILAGGEDLNEDDGCAISGVRIVRDGSTQKCKGFGYVTLRDGTLVSNAIRANGTTYMKRELRVMVCGKRFKGRRGGGDGGGDAPSSSSSSSAIGGKDGRSGGRRSFEGRRATTGMPSSSGGSGISSRKRNSSYDDGTQSSTVTNGGAAKRRRARSEKKTVNSNAGTKSSGLSKRAAAVQKANKRVKKLQNRVVKGMGKKKH